MNDRSFAINVACGELIKHKAEAIVLYDIVLDVKICY